jgi:epoxyqueuosine reductase
MAYAAERMRRRLAELPFLPTHAVIALFPGRVSIGPRGGDYSANREVLRRDCGRLREEHPAYRFLESGNAYPLPAVQAARLAGLGVIGVNGLLHTPEYGSSVTIGAVLTDMPLSDGVPLEEEDGYCPQCGECVRQCPTGALTYDGGTRTFEREKCLSHLRQKQGASLERPGYYGCDICQNVCPMNS